MKIVMCTEDPQNRLEKFAKAKYMDYGFIYQKKEKKYMDYVSASYGLKHCRCWPPFSRPPLCTNDQSFLYVDFYVCIYI